MAFPRKSFLLTLLILATSLSWCQRDTLALDGPWSFAVDSLRIGITHRWFADGLPTNARRSVTVPHTWNTMPGLETYAGMGWYERSLSIPRSWEGRTVSLHFAAVYHDAIVWVNGQKAGEHRGSGFTPFRLDVTRLVRYGGTNTIRVAADNAYSRASIPFDRSFDWPNDGGLIRSVIAVAVPSTGIERLHVSGIPTVTPQGTVGTARVTFDLRGVRARNLTCQISISEEGRMGSAPVAQTSIDVGVSQRSWTQTITVPQVNPWNVDTPFLYTCEVRLLDRGTIVDRMHGTFGFREIRTEGTQILLNGESVRLMGVEWMPGSSLPGGMAETREQMIGMLQKMRGVNAVFTRFHWQQDDAVFDWCDRHGILVQEEVPLWGGATPLNDTILTLAKAHLDEMVAAHHDHPCIVMWGVGNELASHDPVIVKGVRQLYEHAKALDPTRLVNYVSNKAMFSEGRDAIGQGDVLMFNEYQDTWYQGDPARVGGMLDTLHRDYPGKPVVISEYGVCEPAFQGGDERRINDMIYHTAVYESRPYVAGAIYFCLNDYRTHVGEAGEGVLKRRVHGVYDMQGNAKRSAQVLRRMSSPLKVINVPWKGKHQLELKIVGGGGLPRYLCSGYTLFWSSPGQPFATGQKVPLPDLRVNGSIDVLLDHFAGETVVVTIVRPTGDVVDSWDFAVDRAQ